jgi:hypothetical protein
MAKVGKAASNRKQGRVRWRMVISGVDGKFRVAA